MEVRESSRFADYFAVCGVGKFLEPTDIRATGNPLHIRYKGKPVKGRKQKEKKGKKGEREGRERGISFFYRLFSFVVISFSFLVLRVWRGQFGAFDISHVNPLHIR